MIIMINPGSGPVDGASPEQAAENMKHFIADCERPDLLAVNVPSRDYGDGRFAFLVWAKDTTRCHEIQMPGIPLADVRWMDESGQNIWDYPRLYVDGNSFVWKYALLLEDIDWSEPEE